MTAPLGACGQRGNALRRYPRAVDGSGYWRPDPPTTPNVLRTPRAGTPRALLIAGRVMDAASRANTLIQHCNATNQAGVKGWGLHLLASARAVVGSWQESRVLLEAAIALAKPRGMLPLLARCHSLYAVVQRSLGDESYTRLANAASIDCRKLGLKPLFNTPLLNLTISQDDCDGSPAAQSSQ